MQTKPAPVLDDHASPPPRKRRRWPLRVALLLVLLAVAGRAWIARYEPRLSIGMSFDVQGADVTSPETYGGPSVALLAYEAGARFDYAFTLSNVGREPVTVTGMVIDDTSMDDWAIQELGAELAEGSGSIAPGVRRRPFAPFTLRPGDHQVVVVRARFNPCAVLGPGSLHRFETQTVRTRAFGMERVVDVRMRPALVVEGPARGRCDRPGG